MYFLHLPFWSEAGTIVLVALMFGASLLSLYVTWHFSSLCSKLNELEEQAVNFRDRAVLEMAVTRSALSRFNYRFQQVESRPVLNRELLQEGAILALRLIKHEPLALLRTSFWGWKLAGSVFQYFKQKH